MKKLRYLFLLLFSLASIFSIAQVAPSPPQLIEKVESKGNPLIIPYEKWKLSNGLTLIIHEDHSDPIANISVTYHVGSARESIGKSGFAHFFEHMLFQGSEHVGDEEHFKIISEAGGDMNGFTQRDMTVYFETVPSNYVETALWLESDRMGFLLDSVTQSKFEVQRATVKNEKGQNVENQPYAMAYVEILNQALYPMGHPYSWPVIGYVDDLNRVTVDDLKDFFLRWYGPNNAVLSVSGDVNPKDVLAMTEKYFAAIPSCPEVKKLRTPLPILANDQYANYVDNIYLPLTLMVYPTVPTYNKDEAPLDILSSMMGEGNNSIFYKNFVKTEEAIQAGVSHETSELAGEFQIAVFAYPDFNFADIAKSFDNVEKKIHATIDEFEKTGITDEALQRVKATYESRIIDAGESVSGKGMALAEWHTMIGKPYNLTDELDRYNKVTKEDIVRVFNKYIKGKHAAIVNVYPKDPASKDSVKSINPYANAKIEANPEYAGLKYVKAKDNFDRSKRPSAPSAKAPILPEYYKQKLSNGIQIIGTKATESPKVVMLFNMKGGDYVFPAEEKKNGLANLTAGMMDEATENYTTEQISAELDKLGSSISFNAGGESTSIVVSSLTKNLDATLKILEEKLFRPKFDAADFKRIKKQYIESLANDRKQASSVAGKLYRNLIYGNTVLGNSTSEKYVKKFTLDDVKSYYQQFYSPSVTELVIVGELGEKEIMPKLEFLNKWKPKDVKLQEATNIPVIPQTQIYLSHKDDAAQSVIMAGNLGMTYDYAGDYFKCGIMNFPLGGAFNSRLNLNLREEKGFTYGIRSGFSGSKYPGTYTISASVKRSATDSSITEIMKEIANYKKNGITDEELAFTKNSILNSEALDYETPFQKAGFLSRIIRYDLPKDYTNTQTQIVKDITKSDVNSLAAKYLNPDKMVILVVGNKYLIKSKLEKLGYGKVKEIDLE